MVCPHCGTESPEDALRCDGCGMDFSEPELTVLESSDEQSAEMGALIRTGLRDPIGISLVKSLLVEAGVPYFSMDQNAAARQESGNVIGWWTFRVPQEREAEAREILRSVAEAEAPPDL